MSNTFVKDPEAVLDYTFNWIKWLAGDTILSQTISSDGVTIDSVEIAGESVTVWISGGSVNIPASFTCRVVTVGGRTDDRTIKLRIRER